MEELFICQRFDFIVDCVQKVCVTLLYCWCDRINITKRFDSYRESFILLSPCKYFCIVCGECISSSIKKRIVCFLVFIKFYKFNIRIVICEICLCCCSFYNDQLLAFQIFYIFDQRIIRRNNSKSYLHIWKCEVYFFCTLVCDCEVCKNQINVFRNKVGDDCRTCIGITLSVLLIEHLPQPPRRCAGFPDEAFLRGDVPMTKQEVRAAALAKLAVRPTDTLWDVGAGTGSVSVELALAAPRGRVYAVECDPEACALIRKNRERFAAWNLTLIEGKAPQALEALPAPDAVFLGGTKGSMEAVVDAVLAKNPQARLCISAIALETLSAAVAALTAREFTAEVTQIAVSCTKPAGRLHLLMANNPIFLITGERQ